MKNSKDMKIIRKKTVNNEQGFVLISALMMLVILLVIGIAATNTTTIELQISGNDKAAKQNFYAAESSAYEGYGVLKNVKDEILSGAAPPFVQVTASSRDVDIETFRDDQRNELISGIRDGTTWIAEGEVNENSADGALDNTSYRSIDMGASQGSSLSLNNSSGGVVHTYVVVGRYDEATGGRRGEAMIEIGLRIK
ncbi:pilus assembly PilX N-terminal domain-containing protein [uncultured Desulfuromusa sp.]|uniref:pilus assembly PilX family protein n=1 Tax=uncultured Desulfuromusa sp. TaxID=219183 RepID=UPI002AA609FE|nr:pilus assembly PilX N-terminal domain-containing protein [uncultured Desulfuromusa sp.]